VKDQEEKPKFHFWVPLLFAFALWALLGRDAAYYVETRISCVTAEDVKIFFNSFSSRLLFVNVTFCFVLYLVGFLVGKVYEETEHPRLWDKRWKEADHD